MESPPSELNYRLPPGLVEPPPGLVLPPLGRVPPGPEGLLPAFPVGFNTISPPLRLLVLRRLYHMLRE